MRSARVVLAVALAVACSESSGPGALVPLAIEGLPVTDTVRARPTTPVVVTVRDSAGRPIAGDSVFFEGLPPDTFPWAASMALSLDSGRHFDRYRTGVTDSSGRVTALTRMQCYAGTAHLRVRVPAEQRDTTIDIALMPGAAVKLRLMPRDTAVFVGRSYGLRGGVLDACGNLRADPVSRRALRAAVTLHGDSVFGDSVGRIAIEATAGDMHDTVYATPVPLAVLAVNSGCTLTTQNLDGSYQVSWRVAGAACEGMSWVLGSRVLYSAENATTSFQELFAADPGQPGFVVVGGPAAGADISGGRWSAANGRIYYSTMYTSNGVALGNGELFSSNQDGSNRARLQAACSSCRDSYPEASPDGGRVAFAQGSTIAVLLPASGQVTSLGVAGSFPTWSPDGNLIAFVQNGAVWVSGAFPGTASQVSPPGPAVAGRLAWTPNGRFILAGLRFGGLELIELATHAVTPVPNSATFSNPALRSYP